MPISLQPDVNRMPLINFCRQTRGFLMTIQLIQYLARYAALNETGQLFY